MKSLICLLIIISCAPVHEGIFEGTKAVVEILEKPGNEINSSLQDATH